jgi:hypothetical protein
VGGALPMKYSEYFGAKGHESFKVKVFWCQRARVILRMKISGVINRVNENKYSFGILGILEHFLKYG